MNEYDFTNLNPNEFETLANDLLSRLYNLHIESFKPGKDLGIDGDFFVLKIALQQLSMQALCIIWIH